MWRRHSAWCSGHSWKIDMYAKIKWHGDFVSENLKVFGWFWNGSIVIITTLVWIYQLLSSSFHLADIAIVWIGLRMSVNFLLVIKLGSVRNQHFSWVHIMASYDVLLFVFGAFPLILATIGYVVWKITVGKNRRKPLEGEKWMYNNDAVFSNEKMSIQHFRRNLSDNFLLSQIFRSLTKCLSLSGRVL